MKKLLLFTALLITNFVLSQELATTDSGKRVQLLKNGTYKYLKNVTVEATKLKAANFKSLDPDKYYTDKNFLIKNGDGKLTPTNLMISLPATLYNENEITTYDLMIAESNIKTMYSLKNKSTYVPKEISLMFMETKNEWVCQIEYTAQNDYGATKDGKFYCVFDEKGTFTRTF